MIALVYLAWAPAGLEPVRAFLRSYREHPAGADHELVVVLKEFPGDAAATGHRAELAGVAHREVVRPAATQDLPAYVAVARSLEHPLVCCLNSQSVVLDDGWLGKLAAHARREEVGVAGATGSWESHVTGARQGPPGGGPVGALKGSVGGALARRHFPAFPNPHVRTNAFVVRRELLLDVVPGALGDKDAVHRFESGREGLTRRLRGRGLQAVVVGRDGRALGPDQWPHSATYRSGGQRNLLVADNRTRLYEQAGTAQRGELGRLAWGDAYPGDAWPVAGRKTSST